ncbi:MAG TPA: histidine kinase [Salinimicrobium sp.]|nr:histidine kinase [Salinimicrobium sp.]
MVEMDFVPYIFLWHLVFSTLFILFMISGIIAYHSKEKSFRFYSLYCFFLMLYVLLKSPYYSPEKLVYYDEIKLLNWYVQVIYNCLYFVFFIYFLDIQKYYQKFYGKIIKFVAIAFSVSTLFYFYGFFFGAVDMFRIYFIYLFVPVMLVFAAYTVIKALYLPGRLKLFITIGASGYILLAITALVMSLAQYYALGEPLNYFYLGILIEQFVFALGLSYKVKSLNNSLLHQLKENEQIKHDQNKILEKEIRKKEADILEATAKAEEERIARLTSEFENEIQKLHLASLQSQMNPHFIFNALTSIKVFFIENNKEKAIYYLNKFSKLIRKILEGSRVESHSLGEELEIIALYLSIENIRFEEIVEFNIYKTEDIAINNIKVPPLLLQPFVENALWHGLMPVSHPKLINIHIYKDNGFVKMCLKDNGIGREKAGELKVKKTYQKQSMGLKIIDERIDYFNKKQNLNYAYHINDLKNEYGSASGTEVCFSFKK